MQIIDLAIDDKEFDNYIVCHFPNYISFHYQKLLSAKSDDEGIKECFYIFELTLKTLTFILINQYLKHDISGNSSKVVNSLISDNLSTATLSTWKHIFFSILNIYKHEEQLFIPELFKIKIEIDSNRQEDSNIVTIINTVIQIKNEIEFGIKPLNTNEVCEINQKIVFLIKTLLNKILFFKNYKLIYITQKINNAYEYIAYVGTKIAYDNHITTNVELSLNCYYILSLKCEFLELYPLFIENTDISFEKQLSIAGTSLFDNISRESAFYLITSICKKFSNENIVGDLIRHIFYTIEELKVEKQNSFNVSWWHIQNICHEISIKRMSNVLNKFDRSVYLQRNFTFDIFNDFLNSEKNCFVLIGNSGVGKSNFIVSLLNLYDTLNEERCILCYNAATIDLNASLTNLILNDFKYYFDIDSDLENLNLLDFLRLLNNTDQFLNKQLIIIFDAINENLKSKQLLFQINELVETIPYHWIKIVISSRPETWKTIKRGIRLAEAKYYKEKDSELIGHTLLPFTYSAEIQPFTYNELPNVYNNYRIKYNINTSFNELNSNIKELIRDPLILQLVSNIFSNKKIPDFIIQSSILTEYINSLIESERIDLSDIEFLEKELIPLILDKNTLTNIIPSSIINSTTTTKKLKLFDLIHCSDKLQNGNAVNQSFQNLCDCKILELKGEPLSYEIGFKFERFYDYFSGKALFSIVKGSNDCISTYIKYIQLIYDKPYIWGTLSNALIIQLSDNKDIIFELSKKADDNIKYLLVYSISQYGIDYVNEVNQLLKDLFNVKSISKSINDFTLEQCKRIVIEVAYNLSLFTYIENGCSDINLNIRTISIKYLFYYAHLRQSEINDVLLNLLNKSGKNIFKINRFTLESFFSLSVLIFLKYYTNNYLKSNVLDHWKVLFNRLFLFKNYFKYPSLFNKIYVNSFLLIGYHFFNKALNDFEHSAAMVFDVKSFKDILYNKTSKEILNKLIPYLDPKFGSILEIEDGICNAAINNDLFTMYIVTVILTCRLISETDNAIIVCEKLFQTCILKQPALSYVSALLLSISIALYSTKKQNIPLWTAYEKYLDRFYFHSFNHCQSNNKVFWWTEQGRYLYFYYKINNDLNAPLIERFLIHVQSTGNYDSIRLFLFDFSETIIRFGYTKATVEYLLLFVNNKSIIIRNAAIESLSNLSKYFHQEIADILKEHNIPSNIEKIILSKNTEENIGNLFVRTTYEFWREEIAIKGDIATINLLKSIANLAVKSTTTRFFFNSSILNFISVLYQ